MVWYGYGKRLYVQMPGRVFPLSLSLSLNRVYTLGIIIIIIIIN